ncbi:MAG TPA: hypothetical protein VG963_19710 [Polyangiaceae bacterium]|nr:hypothetical protein [Polyangiaceae bacterium]
MRKWFAVGLFLSGTSLWGCSDEKAGPGVGPDTSWQIFPAAGTGGTGLDAHGPIGGADSDSTDDDENIKVNKCEKDTAGLQIELEDPGLDNPGEGQHQRSRSVISISNVNLDKNLCTVTVSDYEDGALLMFVDRCENNSTPGKCTLDLKQNSHGYALEGTLLCEALKISSGTYVLNKARSEGDPMQIQIAHCSL